MPTSVDLKYAMASTYANPNAGNGVSIMGVSIEGMKHFAQGAGILSAQYLSAQASENYLGR